MKKKTLFKKMLSAFTAFAMVLSLAGFMPTAVFAEGESNITFTATAGTAGVSDAENYDKLFDGKYTQGNPSKWCITNFPSDGAYVLFEASEAVYLDGYTFVTGNDNASENGRNPQSWALYGSESELAEDSDEWVKIHGVTDDEVMQDENYAPYVFTCNSGYKFKYYKLVISKIESGTTFQASEFIPEVSDCQHILDSEVVTAPGCTTDGYTTRTCSVCDDNFITDYVEALGHLWDDTECTRENCDAQREVHFEISGDAAEEVDYTYYDNVLTILTDTPITIKNKGEIETTDHAIVVKKDVSANVTLAGVNINRIADGGCAFMMEDNSSGTVIVNLAAGTVNTLTSGGIYAGLQKGSISEYIQCGTLTIRGTGTLNATGGSEGGAGIGTHETTSEGCFYLKGLIIEDGNITATGGSGGAGIGGGNYAACYSLTIKGGNITATGSEGGAGIGSGYPLLCYTIDIQGGNITARGGGSAGVGGAGIGGGSEGELRNITISGGVVTAIGGTGYKSIGNEDVSGAGIGGGAGSGADDEYIRSVRITGGSVKAVAGRYESDTTTSENRRAQDIGYGTGNGAECRSIIPKDANGTSVYCLELANESGEAVTINGKVYPIAHGDEKKVYVYIRGNGEDEVTVGQTTNTYKYDSSRFHIIPKAEHFTFTAPEDLVYTGAVLNIDENAMFAKPSGMGTVTVKYYYNGEQVDEVVNSGTYTVKINVSWGSVYYSATDITSDEWTFEVAKADVDYTSPQAVQNLVYTGEALNLVTAGTATNGTILYSLEENGEYTTTIPTATNAGDYTVYYKVAGNENYNDVAPAQIEVTIEGALPTLNTPPEAVADLEYTGEALNLVTAGTATNGTIHYSLEENGEYTTTIPTATNAGDYTVYYKVMGDDNYKDISPEQIEVTVEKATADITATPSANNLTYTGEAQALVSAGESNFGEVLYKLEDGEYSNQIPTATDAGTYTVYFKVVGTDNYSGVGEDSVTVSIQKAQAQITTEPSANDLTYSGEAQTLVTAGVSNVGEFLYKLGDGEYSSEIPTATNAGTYTVYYKIEATENFASDVDGSVEVEIAKADITVTAPTANELTYSGSAQALATEGTASAGEMLYSLDGESYLADIPTATVAGTYTVYYKVVGDDNYNDVAHQTITVTIAKADITVTAPTANDLTYSGSAQALVTAGETAAGQMLYSLEENGEYTTTIPTATNAGDYTVYYKIEADDNYNAVEVKSVTVTIAKADITGITAPVARTNLTFMNVSHQLFDKGSSPNGGVMVYSFDETSGYVTDALSAKNAGEYKIYYKVLGGDNFNDTEPQFITVTIAKASTGYVTEPSAKTGLVYTGSALELTTGGTVSVGATLVFSLDGENYTESAPTATDVGTYTVYYKLEGDENYSGTDSQTLEVTIAVATNSIKTAPAAVQSLEYTGGELTLVTAGVAKFGEILYKLGDGEYSAELPTATDAGEYTVYYKALGTSNYSEIAEESLTVTIAKADITVTAPTANDLTYSGSAQALVTAGETAAGQMLYSLEENGEYTTTIPTATNAGDYTVYYKIEADDNYNAVEVKSVTVTIAKADSSIVTAPSAVTGLVYSGEEYELLVAGIAQGGTMVYKEGFGDTYYTEIPTATDAGAYYVYYKVIGDENYNDCAGGGFTVRIAMADLEYNTEPAAIEGLVYTGQPQALVTAGDIDVGTIHYALEDTDFSEQLPVKTDAGDYVVTVVLQLNTTNYNGVERITIPVSIAKADITVTAPTAVADLEYTGEAHALVTAGTASAGQMLYSLDGENYSADIPTATEPGTYTVYYKVLGNSNYNDFAAKTVTVTIDGCAHSDMTIKYDDDYHWQYCPDCEEESEKEEHSVMTPATLESGAICECGKVISDILGNVNEDDKTSIRDVVLLYQYTSKWKVEVDDTIADIDGNGTLNIRDVVLLYQYASGWDVEHLIGTPAQ